MLHFTGFPCSAACWAANPISSSGPAGNQVGAQGEGWKCTGTCVLRWHEIWWWVLPEGYQNLQRQDEVHWLLSSYPRNQVVCLDQNTTRVIKLVSQYVPVARISCMCRKCNRKESGEEMWKAAHRLLWAEEAEGGYPWGWGLGIRLGSGPSFESR